MNKGTLVMEYRHIQNAIYWYIDTCVARCPQDGWSDNIKEAREDAEDVASKYNIDIIEERRK